MSVPIRRVLIAGCGDVGTALASRLVSRGITVFGLRRGDRDLGESVMPVQADLLSGQGLDTLPPDIDAVVYSPTPDSRTEEGYHDTFIEGQRRLSTALGRVARWIFVSSTAVYAQGDGQWVDEESPTTPERFNGRALVDAERSIAAFSAQAITLRLGGIYGPGRGRLIERVRAGTPCVEEPPQFANRIHRDDCAAVLAHLLALAAPQTRYIGVDSEPAPMHVVSDWLADQMKVPCPTRIDAQRREGSPGSKRCSNARLLASGFTFAYPSFRDGYAELLQSACE